MAFSATVTRTVGFAPGLWVTYGTWSGAVGDSAGTFKIRGGKMYAYGFVSQDSAGDYDMPPARVSGTAGILTVSVENKVAVTDGTFWILHA